MRIVKMIFSRFKSSNLGTTTNTIRQCKVKVAWWIDSSVLAFHYRIRIHRTFDKNPKLGFNFFKTRRPRTPLLCLSVRPSVRPAVRTAVEKLSSVQSHILFTFSIWLQIGQKDDRWSAVLTKFSTKNWFETTRPTDGQTE